jgi:hypothetical protein
MAMNLPDTIAFACRRCDGGQAAGPRVFAGAAMRW